ncbi:hypothetical protein [Curtobacterium sp. MCBA15_004]|uniref:hypothetical protein n=1 Tax=unclassified Curtobacterium TaxID=257496 RepID=UPI001114A9F7|nr:hypothetical protein [Curtobacterium sp. MCBA15_004]WIA97836.1 hypothetical protein QOL16_05450 [Curtobacterium sp. MCBA15_004]
MISKKALGAASLGGVLAVLLTSCSTPSASNVSAGAVQDAATPTASSVTKADGVMALPFNAGKLLGGNAAPTIAAGEPGQVSVVATGPLAKDAALGSGVLTFAFRNNTAKAISHVDFTATAKAGGKLVASGSSQDVVPAQVQPGEAGFGFIYFEDVSSVPDAGVDYAFRASTSSADKSSYNTAPLRVTEANHNGTSIIGGAVNETGAQLTGPYSVGIYCLDGDTLTASTVDFATEDGDVEPGGTVSFSHDLYETKCDTFTVGVSGWFK